MLWWLKWKYKIDIVKFCHEIHDIYHLSFCKWWIAQGFEWSTIYMKWCFISALYLPIFDDTRISCHFILFYYKINQFTARFLRLDFTNTTYFLIWKWTIYISFTFICIELLTHFLIILLKFCLLCINVCQNYHVN